MALTVACTSSASVGTDGPDGACVGCADVTVDGTSFGDVLGSGFCQEPDDYGQTICGQIGGTTGRLLCSSEEGQVVASCPANYIGSCSGVGGDAATSQWVGNVYYYYAGGDAGTVANAQLNCSETLGTWSPSM